MELQVEERLQGDSDDLSFYHSHLIIFHPRLLTIALVHKRDIQQNLHLQLRFSMSHIYIRLNIDF